jgi:calcineurin-like phosphoesterase family protein
MDIWVTSDLHFGHQKEFLYMPRGFCSIYEHDNAIIKNWNSVVKEEDMVYVLGDIMLNDNDYGRKCFNQLNGFKFIVLGNHDTDARKELYPDLRGVLGVSMAQMIKYDKYHFFLCHYPTIASNHDFEKPLKNRIINLCGHTHTSDKFKDWDKGYIYHCELDAHDLKPVNIDKIIQDIKEKVGVE